MKLLPAIIAIFAVSPSLAFLERAMRDDYLYSGPNGKLTSRARALEYFRQQRDKPDFKQQSLKHDNVRVRVVGAMALVTNDWTAQTSPGPTLRRAR